jgi:hypothetical protein
MNAGTTAGRPAAMGDGAGHRRRVTARVAALAAALAVMALLTVACGGGSPSAADPPGAGQGRLAQALAFAHCMRSHGVPGFPDPDSSGGWMVNPSDNSAFTGHQSARAACAHLYPRDGKAAPDAAQQAQQQRRSLVFAACMRRHGFPNIPDGWSGNIGQLISAGIDPSSPRLNAALTKCGF